MEILKLGLQTQSLQYLLWQDNALLYVQKHLKSRSLVSVHQRREEKWNSRWKQNLNAVIYHLPVEHESSAFGLFNEKKLS